MLGRSTLLAAVVFLLACPRDQTPASSPPPAKSKDAGTSDCASGQVCGQLGATCQAGKETCTCVSLCSGVDWGDTYIPNTWSCREVPAACPEQLPQADTKCRKRGLRCDYGHCGGASATCDEGRWTVQHWDPPA